MRKPPYDLTEEDDTISSLVPYVDSDDEEGHVDSEDDGDEVDRPAGHDASGGEGGDGRANGGQLKEQDLTETRKEVEEKSKEASAGSEAASKLYAELNEQKEVEAEIRRKIAKIMGQETGRQRPSTDSLRTRPDQRR